ncbi:SRCR domain, partial [Trinorchestia longiramus]
RKGQWKNGGFGMGKGGIKGNRGNGFKNPFGKKNTTGFFRWDDDDYNDDDDDDDYDDDDDDFDSMGGQPISFPGSNGGSSVNLDTIREMIQNALTNPDGSINTEALQKILGNQRAGSVDLRSIVGQSPQAPKLAGGNIDLTSLMNTLNGLRDNNNFGNIKPGKPKKGGSAAFTFGRAALQQGKENSAQTVESPEKKSHLELNRRSEMELEDGTLEVSGEVLVGKEREDGNGFELGSVCDEGWGKEEATVVCNIIASRLSKHSAPLVKAEATATAHLAPNARSPYEELEATIKLNGVKCNGDETDILLCEHQGWGDHDCKNNEKASVTCVVR